MKPLNLGARKKKTHLAYYETFLRECNASIKIMLEHLSIRSVLSLDAGCARRSSISARGKRPATGSRVYGARVDASGDKKPPGTSSRLDACTSGVPSRRQVLHGVSIGCMYSEALRRMTRLEEAEAAEMTSSIGSTMAEDIEKRLKESTYEFKLDNGLTVLVRRRRVAPVFSAVTYADVGSFDEGSITGLAHLLEHLAFKGTPRQSRDYKKESILLTNMDDVFLELRDERNAKKRMALESTLDTLQQEASLLAEPNAYGAFLKKEGAVGLNAATSHDSTKYYVSLPSNKLELFFALEAERFIAPVFRDVYSEKKVVLEERKMRVDASPLGEFQERFAKSSFGNNYSRPVIGTEADISRISRLDVEEFFDQHYGPQSLTLSIVGDVDPSQVRHFAEKYFGSWKPSKTNYATPDETLCVPGKLPGKIVGKSVAGPLLLHSFYRPSIRDMWTSIALEIADSSLTGGRNSRLEKALVKTSKALSVSSYSTFPGEKYPTQMLLYGVPAGSNTLENLDGAMLREIERFVELGPTTVELEKFRKDSHIDAIRALQSNASMASVLASYQNLTGSWENIYKELNMTNNHTSKTVSDISSRYLVPSSSYTGFVYHV